MAIRSLYSTNGAVDGYPATSWGRSPNASGCAVAIGAGDDGRYSINVVGRDHLGNSRAAAFALIDRAELREIFEALARELADG